MQSKTRLGQFATGVAILLTAIVGRASEGKMVCAPTQAGEQLKVQCMEQSLLVKLLAETSTDEVLRMSETAIAKVLDDARRVNGIADSEAMVADHQYRLFGRTLSKATKTRGAIVTTQELSEPLPRPLDAMVANPYDSVDVDAQRAKKQRMIAKIYDDAGDNTESEIIYGPPSGPCGHDKCIGLGSRDSCRSCCRDEKGWEITALAVSATSCHAFASSTIVGGGWPALVFHAACGIGGLIWGSSIKDRFDHCDGPHCSYDYAEDRTTIFGNWTISFMTAYDWQERDDIILREYNNNSLRVLRDKNNGFVCHLKKDHPLHDEIPANVILKIAYDKSPCDIKDYRVVDMFPESETPQVPIIGIVRFDEGQNSWFIEQKKGTPLQLMPMNFGWPTFPYPPIDYERGQSYGWQDGAKIMVWGPHKRQMDILHVMSTRVLRKAVK